MKSLKSLFALAPALALAACLGCNDDTMDDPGGTMPPNPTTPTPAPPVTDTDTGLELGTTAPDPAAELDSMPAPTTPGEMDEMPEPTPSSGDAEAPPLDPSTPPVIEEAPSEPTDEAVNPDDGSGSR